MKIFLTAAFLMIAAPLAMWANMAAPSQGGTLTGEPNGLEKIFIRGENLAIDFRSMEAEPAARKIGVEAVYEIENTAADASLKLVFVLGMNEVSEFNFYLDDKQIPSQIKDAGEMPPAWKTPLNTPWHNDAQLGFFPSRNLQKTALIELVIPKGRHVLKAQYKSSFAFYDGYAPRQLFQFAYILAPARDWAGFGGLDLTIYEPEGWEFVTNLNLEESGATVQKHFDRIPADALAFTFGKPLPAGYYRLDEALLWTAWLSVLLPPIFLGWYFRRLRRKGNVPPALGFLLSLPWTILVGAACFASAFGANHYYPTITYGYGDIFYFLAIPCLCAAIYSAGGLIWLTLAFVFRKNKEAN